MLITLSHSFFLTFSASLLKHIPTQLTNTSNLLYFFNINLDRDFIFFSEVESNL